LGPDRNTVQKHCNGAIPGQRLCSPTQCAVLFPRLRWLPVAFLWFALTLTGCASPSPALFPSGSGNLLLSLEGFRNDHGMAIISLFRGEEGFPEDIRAAVKTVTVPITDGKAVVRFAELPYGEYAVCALHDEDEDGEMATSLFGVPREGFAFSGHPDYRFGPPDFKEVRFLLVEPQRELSIPVRYETGRRQHQEEGRTGEVRRPRE
jgi:uncharacterized protein (DUF2141 family)